MGNSEIDIINFYAKKEVLSDIDLNNIYFYLKQYNNEKTISNFLIPLIQKRFPWGGVKHYDDLYSLVNNLDISNTCRIFLLINIFLFSQNGNLHKFVHKESLKEAVIIDQNLTLKNLSQCLTTFYPNNDYMPYSTANLINAFGYAGIENSTVINMYNMGFDCISIRLPDNNVFDWNIVDDFELDDVNYDEIAIVLLLSKTKHHDAEIQRDVFVAIAYLINYDENILIKPLKWFFNNCEKFNQLSIAGVLEILLIEKINCIVLLKEIKGELKQFLNHENLYIRNTYLDLTKEI